MASPDLTDLNDLVLYDANADSLVERAVLDSAIKMPDWLPQTGDQAVVLMESLALIVAEDVYAINRLPGGVLDVLLRILGITRSLGAAPTTTITFTTSGGQPLDIPQGSIVRLTLGDGSTLDFTTDAHAVGAGPTLTTAATATAATAAANGIVTGTPVAVISALPAVDSAALASNVAAGADPEEETPWRTRGVQQLQRLTSTLVAPAQFVAAALTNPLVYRATALDNNNNGVATPGYVTVAVVGSAGAMLSSGDKTALQVALAAQAQANLAVVVIDPTITSVTVTATVHPLTGYTTAQVQANVAAALDAYLSPDTWLWSGTVRRNKLIQVIEDAEGVDYLTTLSAPAADVTLTGVAPLADFNSGASVITVT